MRSSLFSIASIHSKNARADTAAHLENAAKALHGQHAGLPQREIANDGENKLFELFAGGPSWQRDGVKAPRQLNVTVDGVSRLHDPEADERKFQLVAEKAQAVQHDALFSPRTGEDIVDLVENEDLDANVAKRVDSTPLHIDDASARIVRRVDGGEDLREEPSLGGASAQFNDEQLIGIWRRVGRAIRFELVHQHGLPHPAVAIDDQGWHPRGARMLEQLVQVVENVDGFWIGDPALRLDK